MVDETGLDEPNVDKLAVDEVAVDEPGPHRNMPLNYILLMVTLYDSLHTG